MTQTALPVWCFFQCPCHGKVSTLTFLQGKVTPELAEVFYTKEEKYLYGQRCFLTYLLKNPGKSAGNSINTKK